MVLIVLPVLNAAPYLKDCLESISGQTLPDWQLWIYDDGSTDGSLEILKDYVAREPRARLFCRDHSYIDNINEPFDRADLPFIARMDADDIMHPDRLAEQIRLMTDHSDIAVLSSTALLIDETGRQTGSFSPPFVNCPQGPDDLAFMNGVIHPSVMFRADVFRADPELRYRHEALYAEDYELWTRCLEKGLKVYIHGTPLLDYRIVGKSMSRTHREEISVVRHALMQRLFKLMNR